MGKKFNPAKIVAECGNKYIYGKDDPRAKTEWIDTRSYPMNAIISGSLKKGIPDNRSIMLVGPESAAKSFFALRMLKSATDTGYFAIMVDVEGDKDEDIFRQFGFKGRGIDYEILKVKTVEDLRKQLYNIITPYREYFEDLTLEEFPERKKIIVAVDSIAFLSTDNTEANLKKGKVVQELKLPQQLKNLFRDINIDCNVCKIPLIFVNHVYDTMDIYSVNGSSVQGGKKISGGSGARYGSSCTLYMDPKQKREETTVFSERDGKSVEKKVVTGTHFTVIAMKGRYIQAGSSVDIFLDYKKGIHPNYGLSRFCESAGLVEKVQRGGKGTFYKLLYKKDAQGNCPEVKSYQEYIPEMLDLIDQEVGKQFKFGAENYNENGELEIPLADDEPSTDIEE